MRGVVPAVAVTALLLLLTVLPDSSLAKGGSRGGGSRGGSRGGGGSSGGRRGGGDSHKVNTPRPYVPPPRPTSKPSAPVYNPESSYPKQPAVNPGWNPPPGKPAQPAQPGWNPPPPQPGWNPPPQSGQAQPGWKQPGQHQPGQPQPGWAQPGQTQPGQHQSGQPQPGWAQPGQPQPGLSQPGQPQPGWAQPGQPGWKQPGQYQPGAPQPGWAQPGQPGHYQPGSGQPAYQPGWGQPGHQPAWGQPGHYQPGSGQPGYQPGWGQSGHQPGWGQPGYNQPGWGQHQSGWGQPSYPGQHGYSYPGQFGGGGGLMHSNNVGQHSYMTNSYHPSYFGNSGYKSKNKFFPSFGGGGGGFYGGSYGRVGSFGSSKLRYAPLIPLLFLLPFVMPRFTPSMFRSCTCATINHITVCPNKLSDGHVPSCVDDDSNAIFILSRKVNYLSGDAFRHVRKLEYINVTRTNVEALPRDVFQYSPKLKTLVVQSNHDLSTLDGDLFRGLSSLETLFLDHNELERLDADLLRPLEALTTLNLGHNRLANLPATLLERNTRLTELALSGNGLHDLPEDLLARCPKLRVLLLRDNRLRTLPAGLFKGNQGLEWLDLGRNDLVTLPAVLLKPCTHLGWLGLTHNRLETLDPALLLDHGGSLSALQLADNPWQCSCDLLPVAGWVVLRPDALDGSAQPACSAPADVHGWELRRWFHDKGSSCEASPLQGRLQELLKVALALAWGDPAAGLNASVSFVAASHFRYALAAETSLDPDLLVGRFLDLLKGVYGRSFPGVNNSTTGNTNSTSNATSYSEVSEVEKLKMKILKATTVEEIEAVLNEITGNRTKYVTAEGNGTRSGTVENTTVAVSVAGDSNSTLTRKQVLQQELLHVTAKNELYESLIKSLRERLNNVSNVLGKPNNTSSLNFTFIFKDVPQNISTEVDKGIVEELRLLFGANTTSNVTGNSTTNSTPTSTVALNLNETSNSTVNTNTENVTDTTAQMNSSATDSNTTLLSNTDNSPADGNNTLTPDSSSSNGSNSSVTDASNSPTNTSSFNNNNNNHTVANSTASLGNVTLTDGLRSEFRQVMMMLLTSIDRAKWDMENINYKNTSNEKPKPPSSNNLYSKSSATHNKLTAPIVWLHLLSAAIVYRFL